MTSSLPNEPLWPRAGRSGRSAADDVVVELRRPGRERAARVGPRLRSGRRVARSRPGRAQASDPLRVDRLGRIRGQRPCAAGHRPRTEALDPREDAPLALVEAVLDVGREDVPAAGRPDAERDRHRVVRLVGDRDARSAPSRAARPARRPARGGGPPAGRSAAARSRCRASRCRGRRGRAPSRRPPWPPSGRPSSRAGRARSAVPTRSGRASRSAARTARGRPGSGRP